MILLYTFYFPDAPFRGKIVFEIEIGGPYNW